MTVLFDRNEPMMFVKPDEFDGNFSGIKVDAPEEAANFLTGLNDLLGSMKLRFLEVGAPEDYNQQLADEFIVEFNRLMEVYNEAITGVKTLAPASPSEPTEGNTVGHPLREEV